MINVSRKETGKPLLPLHVRTSVVNQREKGNAEHWGFKRDRHKLQTNPRVEKVLTSFPGAKTHGGIKWVALLSMHPAPHFERPNEHGLSS